MAETAELHLGIGVDTRDFAKFAKALRKAEPGISRSLALRLRATGAIVAEEARAHVEEVSQSVPPSIKVRVSGATVSVVAGGARAPLGGLLELGNKGQRRTAAPTFKHPVFGSRDVWVEQRTHPFLAPAVEAKAGDVERAAIDALDAAVAEVVGGG